MKVNLIKDFSPNSYLYRTPEKNDISGMLFNLQYTGYEEIGINYHLNRSEYESFMLTYTIKGSSNMIYSGNYYKVPTNSLIFIDCMKPHETWGDSEGYTVIYIHIFNPQLFAFCRYIQSLASPVIQFQHDEIDFIQTVKKIHYSMEQNQYDEILTSKEIYALLLRLKEYVEKNNINVPIAPPYIHKTIDFIMNHYQHKLTLKHCADYISLSPNYLETIFSNYIGCSIAKYIAQFRLTKSQYLLINTEYSIASIAQMVGLEESQVLIRLFKKFLSITPLNYRKRYKKQIEGQLNK